MSDELREELEGLAEAWEDDAASYRESGDDRAAEVSDDLADEIRALLARHAAAAGGPGGG